MEQTAQVNANTGKIARPHQLVTVQSLRGFAATLVAFGHILVEASRMPGGSWVSGPAIKFHFGVDVFFIISGFIMVYTNSHASRGAESGAKFFAARFLRLSPLYWAATLLAAASAWIIADAARHGAPGLGRILASLFYIPYQNENGDMFPIIGPGWTLNFEMLFYLIFAVGLAWRGARGVWPTIACIVAIVLVGFLIRPEQPQFRFWMDPIQLEFTYGMVLGLVIRSGIGIGRAAAITLMVLGFVGYLCLCLFNYGRDEMRFVMFGIPALLLVAGAVMADVRALLPRFRLGEIIGGASYSIYLIHPFVIRGVNVVFHRSPVHLPVIVYIIGATIAVLVAGVLVARYFEIPIHERTRRWLHRKPAAPLPDAG